MADRIPVCDSASVGSGVNPVFVKDTKISQSTSTLGNTTKPVYLKSGSLTECVNLAPVNSPNFTGTPTTPTPSDSSNSKVVVNKEYVDNWLKVSSEQSTGNKVGVINGTTLWSGPLAKDMEIITINVPLLTPMWFDYKVTNDEWIYSPESDLTVAGLMTQSEYKAIYDHLAADIATSDITKTDTFNLSDCSTVSISYRSCADGHKVCIVNTEWVEGTTLISNLNKLMNDPTIGCAWYFVLDTTNKRFALPRTKYGFHGGLQYAKSTLNAKQKHLLYFFSGDYSNTTNKMDLVKAGVGDCKVTATTNNIATYGVAGQVVDSGRKVVDNTSASNLNSDMTDVQYVNSKIGAAKTEVTSDVNTKLTNLETTVNSTVNTKVTNLTNNVNTQLTNQTTTVNNKIAELEKKVNDALSGVITFDSIYPVGSVYISTTNYDSLPAIFTSGGRTWTKIGSGACLWGATSSSDMGSSINGSLPNITGTFSGAGQTSGSVTDNNRTKRTGAFYVAKARGGVKITNSDEFDDLMGFEASRSNSIYSATAGTNVVRPTSIGVTFWQRTS